MNLSDSQVRVFFFFFFLVHLFLLVARRLVLFLAIFRIRLANVELRFYMQTTLTNLVNDQHLSLCTFHAVCARRGAGNLSFTLQTHRNSFTVRYCTCWPTIGRLNVLGFASQGLNVARQKEIWISVPPPQWLYFSIIAMIVAIMENRKTLCKEDLRHSCVIFPSNWMLHMLARRRATRDHPTWAIHTSHYVG